MPPKKTAALTKWDAELAALAQSSKDLVKNVGTGSANFISLRNGVLSYKDQPAKDNKMNVVIIDSCLVNAYYDHPFDPDAGPSSPACFALGRVAAEMAPHETVEHPVNPNCKTCKNKKFASAEKGKGKACGDLIRLAMIAATDLDSIAEAEVAHLMLPFFSTVEYSEYVRQLAELYRKPPLAYVTEICLVPDKQANFKTKFRQVEPIEEAAQFEALINKYKVVSAEIMFPFPKFEAEEKAPPVSKKKRKF